MIRISTHQFTMLSAATLLGTTFMVASSVVVREAGRDGWLAVLPGFLVGIPFALMVLSLLPKYPNKNFIEISEKVLGKWLGKAFGLFFALITIYYGAALSSQDIDMLNRTMLPMMPYPILVGGGIILILHLYFSGFEVLARFSEVIFPIVYMSLLLICIFIIPRFEQGELFPILGDGMVPIIKAMYMITPWPAIYMIFLFVALPFLPHKANDCKQLRKGLLVAFLLVGIINTLVVLVQIMTFGPSETRRVTYGLLVLGNMVEISRTVSGIEAIFLLVWKGASLIKVTVFFFAGMTGLRNVFGIKSRLWALAIAAFYAVIPMYIIRGTDVYVEITLLNQYVLLPFTLCWLILVWGVDKWKSRQKSS